MSNVRVCISRFEAYGLMRAIGNACVDLPYAIERWEDDLKPDRRQWVLTDKPEHSSRCRAPSSRMATRLAT
eukprot:990917-Prymnesium_polylepis.1